MNRNLWGVSPYDQFTYGIRQQTEAKQNDTPSNAPEETITETATESEPSTSTPTTAPALTTTTGAATEELKMDYANGLLQQLARIREERAKSQEDETEEQERQKKELRKVARERVLASVGHGINALVNLGATTAYAPSAQVPNLAEPWQKRYEEMEKKREANKSFHQKAMQNLQTQEYTVTKALADLGLKDKDFIRKLLETQNRNQNRDASTANSAKVADARVKNLDSSTELNGHKADLADKQGEATLRNARSSEVKAKAAATNAGNNTRRTNSYVAKGGSGNKEYTETTVTDAVNPITGEQYKKATTKTRSNSKNIPGFSN